MHFGKANRNVRYHMKDSNGQQLLDESKLEKDIGVMVSNDLDVFQQVNMVVSKANRMLGLILNTFTYLNWNYLGYCTVLT